jgi:hypothetical protein
MSSSAPAGLKQSASLRRLRSLNIGQGQLLNSDLRARRIVDYSPCGIVRRHSAALSGLHLMPVPSAVPITAFEISH